MKKKFLLIFYCITLLAFASHSSLYSQQVFKITPTSVIPYLEYLPEHYGSNSDKYPVVIFLHGIGERGPNTKDPAILRNAIQNVTRNGPPRHIKNGHQFPFILISPQLKNNYGNWPSAYVMEVINYVKTYLRIDEKRIYLTGLSLGGGGAWWTAQDHPELFAALAPVCGGRNTPSMACGIAAENLPVWAFHGDKDTIVPISRTINMVNAINNCVPAINPKAKMTTYPGVAHDSWNNAYKTDHSIHDPNVYEWMLSHTNTINAGNKLPTADAGSDKTLSGTTISLVGAGSDPDGTISDYRWTQLSGPTAATLDNKTTRYLYTSNMKPGEYVFGFRVTDNAGGSDTDYIKVKIGNSNISPVANAGADMLVKLPVNSVGISGSASDKDGTIASHQWTQASGPSCSLADTTTPSLSVSDLTSGTYVFRLTVTDNTGLANYDDVVVNVTFPPMVDAGTDKSVNLPVDSIILTGAASDPDGTIHNYKWSKHSGPAATLVDSLTSSVTVKNLKEGTYVFMLEVSDNLTAKANDYVTVTVKSEILFTSFPATPISKIIRENIDSIAQAGSHTEIRETVLNDMTSHDLEDCLVAVFNGTGDQIFSGAWTLEKWNEIFSKRGFYIYHVMKEGRQINTGKIYIRN